MKRLLKKTKKTINKFRYNIKVKKVLVTKPVKYTTCNKTTVLSMVSHKDLCSYLVAVKSFLYWFDNVKVKVINDGSLDNNDLHTLEWHIPGIEIFNIKDINTISSPKGGCWERLYKLVELSADSYIIQLDSDIIINGPLNDIYNYIELGESFTIGNPKWSEAASIEYISSLATKWSSNHIQTLAERAMPSLPMLQNKNFRITRGCAGFCGIPKGAVTQEYLELFSSQMENMVGKDKWKEWGSEQVASNFLVSSCAGANVLPWPKYQNFMHPKTNETSDIACTIHFMGTNRYDERCYEKLTEYYIKVFN